MTSKLKCPFCQQELDTSNYYTRCRNPHCDITTEMEGTEEMWDALVRTHKALDVAVDALKEYEDRDSYDCNGDWCGCEYSTAHEALEQITAPEQKEQN